MNSYTRYNKKKTKANKELDMQTTTNQCTKNN